MWFLRETHEVAGAHEREFEMLYRDAWMPALARSPGARLLFFLRHAHGTGPSYRVITWTALTGGDTWQQLAERVAGGDLSPVARELDALRHEVHAKLFQPLPWSPLQQVDLASIPTEVPNHNTNAHAKRALALFMEDTVHPHEGRLDQYVEAAGSHYTRELREHDAQGRALLRLEGSFRAAFGSHRRREVVLWQRVIEPKAIVPLLTREVPDAYLRPGTWMHDALALRDQWQSRLLRTVAWSPLG
jgi:hypothetical protein